MITRYILPLISVAALAFAAVQVSRAQQKSPPASPPVEPAKSPYESALAGAGIVEPETENISIGTHVAGVVEQVFVRVGDKLRPGDPLFRIDDRHLKAELAIREAAVLSARASLEKLKQQPRQEELPPSRAKILEAQANLRDAQKLFDRSKRLQGTNSLSEEEFGRREVAVQVAEAQLQKAKAEFELLQAGAWGPDKDVASAAVFQAEAQVNEARMDLERLTVRAPRTNWSNPTSKDHDEFQVLQVIVHPGEFVGTVQGQALIVLGCVGRLHVRVDVDENDIGRFRSELVGIARPRGNANLEVPLQFVRVEPYVIPKRSLTGGNTERVDTRVLQVIYRVNTDKIPLYVGQQMDVFLNLSQP